MSGAIPDDEDELPPPSQAYQDAHGWVGGRAPAPNGEDRSLDGWDEPVDFEVIRAGGGGVTADHVPAVLWAFVKDTSERMGVATSSVALGAIVSCSAAISEEWRIQPKRHDWKWTEQARLWGAIVGPPSIKKSPIVAEVSQPIVALDGRAHAEWKVKWKAYKAEEKAWKEAGRPDPAPVPPRKDRYLVENATIEALSEVLRDDSDGKMRAPLGKVLVRQDELSEFLAGLDRYTPNGKGSVDRGAYLRLYNGGSYPIDRIIRGSYVVPSWSGCILGGIQPEPIQRIADEADNDGLLQRFIYDVPPAQSRGEDRKPDYPAIVAYRELFVALVALRPARAPEEGPTEFVVTVLHDAAHAARDDIYALIEYMVAVDSSPRLQSAVGKWEGLFARLCLTFHLIEIAAARSRNEIGPHPDVVPAETAERVRRYMREILAPHLIRADAVMFNTPDTDHAAWVAGYILAKRLDRVTVREIVQDHKALRPPEKRQTLHGIMDSLSLFGWLIPEESRIVGKPPIAWTVNPRVHVQFATRAQRERERRAAVRAMMDAKMARASP